MLSMQQTWDIQAEMMVSDDDKANAPDHELMTHARNLMLLVRTAEQQLETLRGVLIQRRDFIDGVIWQINELTNNPTLVLEKS